MLKEVTQFGPWRAELQNLFWQRAITSDRPLSLVIYGDELTPGNVLKLNNNLKMMAWYFTVYEFAERLTRHEAMWLPLGVISSNTAKGIPGGLSHVFKVMMKQLFEVEKIQDEGVILELDEPMRFFFKMRLILLDGEANRAIWSCKGASGKLCCFRCLNCVRDRNIATRNNGFAHVSECDFSQFIVASDEAIWRKVDSLTCQVAEHEAGRATKASVDDLSTAMGFTFQSEGILFDKGLRQYIKPATHERYDSMHNLVSNGLAQLQTALLIKHLREVSNFQFEDLRIIGKSGWKVASAFGNSGHIRSALSAKRFDKGDFTASASDMLLAMPVFLHYLELVATRSIDLGDHLPCYQLLCEMCKHVSQAKRGLHDREKFRAACAQHLKLFCKCYTVPTRLCPSTTSTCTARTILRINCSIASPASARTASSSNARSLSASKSATSFPF